MALSISGYKSELMNELSVFNGTQLEPFCLAVATGVVNTAIAQVGIISSPDMSGVSSGVGIVTISASNISDLIFDAATAAFGGSGTELRKFCDAVGAATVTHFALATLASDTNGTALFPAFTGVISIMASAIENAAPFSGPMWPPFALAIATGICTEIGSNGTGTLSGAVLPPPGGGTVTIS